MRIRTNNFECFGSNSVRLGRSSGSDERLEFENSDLGRNEALAGREFGRKIGRFSDVFERRRRFRRFGRRFRRYRRFGRRFSDRSDVVLDSPDVVFDVIDVSASFLASFRTLTTFWTIFGRFGRRFRRFSDDSDVVFDVSDSFEGLKDGSFKLGRCLWIRLGSGGRESDEIRTI